MRTGLYYLGWIALGLILGLALAQYDSGGMLMAFLHKLPGCF